MDVRQPIKLLVGSLVIALALAIAACGATPGGAGTGYAPAAQDGATPGSTASARATASPSPPIPRAAPVALAPGAAHYAVSDTITITVQNTTGRTIYALAQFTDCSIISLEYRVGDSWQLVHLCTGGFPHPSITSIAPGGTVAIQLAAATAPGSETQSEVAEWPMGTYRAALTYTTSTSESFSQGTIIYSATFAIT